MEGGNTTVRLFVTSAVLQRLVTFEFRLERRIRSPVGAGLLAKAASQATHIPDMKKPADLLGSAGFFLRGDSV
ncbi:hypothetical protein, partial [Pseudomonas sp. ANT_J28]|uniref:hypothetical protein n=1 Tax=Pseudomonas sp. ANT_J28 TaxID=2597352 RepID=UPI001C49B38B